MSLLCFSTACAGKQNAEPVAPEPEESPTPEPVQEEPESEAEGEDAPLSAEALTAVVELEEGITTFYEAIDAVHIQCEKAKPASDGICELRKVLCESAAGGNQRSSQCRRAREACTETSERYRVRCD